MPDDNARPRWSIVQAAKHCGVSRSTIQRYLARGAMPGAYLTDTGAWSIGVEDLLAAGFHPDRYVSPPAAPRKSAGHRDQDDDAAELAATHAAELAELAAELAAQRARAELAEAVAAERAAQITDLRRTVAALEAAPRDRGPGVPVTSTPPPAPEPVRPRGLLGRVLGPLLE